MTAAALCTCMRQVRWVSCLGCSGADACAAAPKGPADRLLGRRSCTQTTCVRASRSSLQPQGCVTPEHRGSSCAGVAAIAPPQLLRAVHAGCPRSAAGPAQRDHTALQVSDGDLLKGVRYFSGGASTNSIVMRSQSGTGGAAALPGSCACDGNHTECTIADGCAVQCA